MLVTPPRFREIVATPLLLSVYLEEHICSSWIFSIVYCPDCTVQYCRKRYKNPTTFYLIIYVVLIIAAGLAAPSIEALKY